MLDLALVTTYFSRIDELHRLSQAADLDWFY
jgi:hypothetical protein